MVIRKPPDAGGSGWETTDPRNVNFSVDVIRTTLSIDRRKQTWIVLSD